LADGTERERPWCTINLDWHGEGRLTEVLVLDGNPLLGTQLLAGSLVQIEMADGGEVLIEPL
jgi:YD repeat-containing protein